MQRENPLVSLAALETAITALALAECTLVWHLRYYNTQHDANAHFVVVIDQNLNYTT